MSNSKEDSELRVGSEMQAASALADLVVRAREGDSDAFAQLVRKYQRRCVSVAYRLLGNLEDASDVSQDAFVRAYRSLSQLEDPTRFGGWLMRVVTNLALNFRRSRATHRAASLDEDAMDGDTRDPLSGRKSHRDAPAGREELDGAIQAAMNTLPDKQRLALVLFSVEGMPQKEVAEILECSIELVKWNVFQARKKLKDALQEFMQ